MEQLREYNKKLLYNILPDHVAQHFLAQQAKKNDVSLLVSIFTLKELAKSGSSFFNNFISNDHEHYKHKSQIEKKNKKQFNKRYA